MHVSFFLPNGCIISKPFERKELSIMKKSFLTLSAAALLLCSCGASPAISSQNTSLSEFTGWTEESLKDPEESEIPSSVETSLSTEESKEESSWSKEEEGIIRSLLNGILIPNFGMTDYIFQYDEEMMTFEALGLVQEGDPTVYMATLQELGWDITYIDSTQLIVNYVFEDYSYDYLSLSLEEDQDGFALDIYGTYLASFSTWPEEDILLYSEYTGLTEGFPSLEGADAYVHYIQSYYGLFYVSVVECYGETVGLNTYLNYTEKLENNGYTYDDSLGAYDNGSVCVEAYYENGLITLYAYGYEEEPAWGENWVIPTPGEGVFDYSNEDQITTKGNQKSVWTSGNSTFTVEQGESTVYVGNTSPSKSFFSNPLRLYTKQVVTLSSEAPFSSVTFYVAENEKTDRYNLIDIELDDASWNVDLDAQTIELSFPSPATEYSFILTEGQVHLHYLVLNFAE